jgi:hypothetical protein
MKLEGKRIKVVWLEDERSRKITRGVVMNTKWPDRWCWPAQRGKGSIVIH